MNIAIVSPRFPSLSSLHPVWAFHTLITPIQNPFIVLFRIHLPDQHIPLVLPGFPPGFPVHSPNILLNSLVCNTMPPGIFSFSFEIRKPVYSHILLVYRWVLLCAASSESSPTDSSVVFLPNLAVHKPCPLFPTCALSCKCCFML